MTIQRSSTDIATELAQFRSARAALIAGERIVEVWRDGRRMNFSEAALDDINATIDDLIREYEQAVAYEAGKTRRRPISLMYRN